MARIANPSPPIFALYALHDLYAQCRGLDRSQFATDKDYAKKLDQALKKDGVASNTNFVRNYRGLPLEAEASNTTGMSTIELGKIAAIIMNHYKLSGAWDVQGLIEPNWQDFASKLFPTPRLLAKLDEARYYKFLDIEVKKAVRSLFRLRCNELGLETPELKTYFTYIAQGTINKAGYALATFDVSSEVAYYYEFEAHSEQYLLWRSVHSAGLGLMLLLYMEADNDRKAMLVLQDPARSWRFLHIMSGTIMFMDPLSNTICAEIIMEKCPLFSEVLHKINNESDRNPLYTLEVSGRILETDAPIVDKALKRYETFSRLTLIEGHYICIHEERCGYPYLTLPDQYYRSVVFIGANGIVKIKEGDNLGQGNVVECDYSYLQFRLQTQNGHDEYFLHLLGDDLANDQIRALIGFCAIKEGIYNYRSDVVLIRVDTKQTIFPTVGSYGFPLRQGLFTDMKDVEDSFSISSERIDMNNISNLEKQAIKMLKKKWYDNAE